MDARQGTGYVGWTRLIDSYLRIHEWSNSNNMSDCLSDCLSAIDGGSVQSSLMYA